MQCGRREGMDNRLILSSTAADDFLASTLIDAYSESNDLTYARNMFDQLPLNNSYNTLAYNSLLMAYFLNKLYVEELKLFDSWISHRDCYSDLGDFDLGLRTMAEVGSDVDEACLGRMIHGYVIKIGIDWVGDWLVSCYSRCADVQREGMDNRVGHGARVSHSLPNPHAVALTCNICG